MVSEPQQEPTAKRATMLMVAGAVLVSIALVMQLIANHAMQDQPAYAQQMLRGFSEILMGTGGICEGIGAWRLWRWKKSQNPAP